MKIGEFSFKSALRNNWAIAAELYWCISIHVYVAYNVDIYVAL
jgi:hypothetical protein